MVNAMRSRKVSTLDHGDPWQQMIRYQPEAWRIDDTNFSRDEADCSLLRFTRAERNRPLPGVWDQTQVLELLGRINYRIIKGKRVYVEVGGVVYKTLYGGYWRSVFTGVEHYLLRCEQVSGSIWAADESGNDAASAIDLPIAYSNHGWTASGYSLSFMLARD